MENICDFCTKPCGNEWCTTAEKNAKIDKLPKDNYVVCLKHGEKYSADYVNKLHSMVSRNCSIPFEFICFTENTKGINKVCSCLSISWPHPSTINY